MYKKMYMIYNERTEQLTGEIFLCYNDREAEYNYSIYIQNSKEKNKYFMESDYKLTCLGVLQFDNKEVTLKEDGTPLIRKMGIDTRGEYPYIFDKIKDGWKPQDEQRYMDDITSQKTNYEDMKKEYNKELKEMQGVK